jgi:hypothetical protein
MGRGHLIGHSLWMVVQRKPMLLCGCKCLVLRYTILYTKSVKVHYYVP